jgi:hypothetical protein
MRFQRAEHMYDTVDKNRSMQQKFTSRSQLLRELNNSMSNDLESESSRSQMMASSFILPPIKIRSTYQSDFKNQKLPQI